MNEAPMNEAPMNEDFKIDLDRCRVTHLPTGRAYSFPERARAGDLQLWQVVEIGRHARDVPEHGEIRKMAFDLYVAAMRHGNRPRRMPAAILEE